jgi:hypothetical protein
MNFGLAIEARDTASVIPIGVPGTADSPWGGMAGSDVDGPQVAWAFLQSFEAQR